MPIEIVIKGPMASGKTVVAAVIAQELKLRGYSVVVNDEGAVSMDYDEIRKIRGVAFPVAIKTELTNGH